MKNIDKNTENIEETTSSEFDRKYGAITEGAVAGIFMGGILTAVGGWLYGIGPTSEVQHLESQIERYSEINEDLDKYFGNEITKKVFAPGEHSFFIVCRTPYDDIANEVPDEYKITNVEIGVEIGRRRCVFYFENIVEVEAVGINGAYNTFGVRTEKEKVLSYNYIQKTQDN